MNASDMFIETLMDWGVDTIFGLPGDGINGIMEALRTRQEKVRFIQVRHEESAAFMACAYAKFTGRPQGLNLQELVIGEGLEGTAKIGVGLGRVCLRAFDEGFAIQQIGSPGIGIENAEFLRFTIIGILSQSQVFPG